MTRPLFELYKEALRKGHLAARGGTIDAALEAYAEAARLAPDRAAPHTSSATALHHVGRTAEAQAAFERALAIAPDDEATLRARAVVFEEIGRSASAAADLEHLAEALEASGRGSDALAVARRAVVLTATPARRRLVARLEASAVADRVTGRPIQAALAPMPPPLSAPKAEPVPPPRVAPIAPGKAKPATGPRLAGHPSTAPQASPRKPRPPKVVASTPSDMAPSPERSPELAPAEAPAPGQPANASVPEPAATAPEPATPLAAAPTVPQPAVAAVDEAAEPAIPWPAVDLPSPPPPMPVGPPPNVETLMADARALIDRGDLLEARNLMLTAVAVHRAAGRPDAALDVCLQLLALAPGDAYVHLAIAGLQLDRGWRTLATEKIALLLRLTALTGDTQAEADVHALAAERVRDEPPASVTSK